MMQAPASTRPWRSTIVPMRAGKPGKAVGATEAALQALSTQLGMDDAAIRRDLRISRHFDFEHTELYERVYEVAERAARGPLARARMP